MITKYNTESKVESFFIKNDPYFSYNKNLRKIPVIIVDNYVELGQLAALRFLEWVCLNPGGVIALPTGRTPEYYIKWVQYYLENWDHELNQGILSKIGLDKKLKPDMSSLHFFQLDEFFPIEPDHERSFLSFVKKYYIESFGLDYRKTNLINTFHFNDAQKKIMGGLDNVLQVFQDGKIDLALRIEKPTSIKEQLKQKVIKLFDQFCNEYEDKIRNLGGIGFFLGGIGPDGHIAFNVRGSSHHSHTRLTNINYETQAAAAADLGGIESVRKKAVITMGLETITFNPDNVAIIIAAGESKAKVIRDAVEKNPDLEFPGSALQKLHHARFFITESSSILLKQSEESVVYFSKQNKSEEKAANKLIFDAAFRNKVSLMELANNANKDILEDPDFKLAQKLTMQNLPDLAEQLYAQLREKIERGIKPVGNLRFMHTAPHHDDIELAYFPYIHHLVRSETNDNHFVYCTSGFTAVTNDYVINCLRNLINSIQVGLFESDQFHNRMGENYAQDDITEYLNGIARQNKDLQSNAISFRIARRLLKKHLSNSIIYLKDICDQYLQTLEGLIPGRKEPDYIHHLKGWLREFEAELVWAHLGINIDKVKHLDLAFYSDDIFPKYPDHESDVVPILKLLEEIKPNVITLALDPEGSGPDTHYKTLIALSEAIDEYVVKHKESNLRIWGYRNIWSKWDPSEVNTIIPISLNSFATLHSMFNNCFLSQKSASFPSFELDGTFSELAQKIWAEQFDKISHVLGKSYFYDSPNQMLRRSYGALYIKDMSYREFSEIMKPVRRLIKAKELITEK